jgi:hypothetical protein
MISNYTVLPSVRNSNLFLTNLGPSGLRVLSQNPSYHPSCFQENVNIPIIPFLPILPTDLSFRIALDLFL